MTKLAAHEFIHLQEHIRSESASLVAYQNMAEQSRDPELKEFIENQARECEERIKQLYSFLEI